MTDIYIDKKTDTIYRILSYITPNAVNLVDSQGDRFNKRLMLKPPNYSPIDGMTYTFYNAVTCEPEYDIDFYRIIKDVHEYDLLHKAEIFYRDYKIDEEKILRSHSLPEALKIIDELKERPAKDAKSTLDRMLDYKLNEFKTIDNNIYVFSKKYYKADYSDEIMCLQTIFFSAHKIKEFEVD